jgi:hypothetical protein
MEFIHSMIPMAVFLAVGYIMRKTGVANETAKNFANKYLFYFAMPCLAFRSIASFNFKEAFVPGLVFQNIATTLLAFLIMLGAVMLIKNKKARSAAHMAVYRSNQGYIGMYAVRGMYGELALSKSAVVNGFDNPFVNILAVSGMEILRERESGARLSSPVVQVVVNVLKNPFVIAVGLGMAESAIKTGVLKIKAVDYTMALAGDTALPLALVLIGASITFTYMRKNITLVGAVTAAKLLVVPFMAFLLGRFVFGLEGTDLAIGVTMLATPSAVSGYVFAREMGADQDLMASCIGFSTVISIITLPLVNMIMYNI